MATEKPQPKKPEPPPVKRKKDGSSAKYTPNVTPLIDVLFLLLLFFLLASRPRQNEGQIPANLPEIGNTSSAAADPRKLNLTVASLGERRDTPRFDFGESSYASPEDLYVGLKRRVTPADAEEVTVLIKVGREVRWKHVVEAFNQARRAGWKKIGFAPVGT